MLNTALGFGRNILNPTYRKKEERWVWGKYCFDVEQEVEFRRDAWVIS
jgi:hypothetical protein